MRRALLIGLLGTVGCNTAPSTVTAPTPSAIPTASASATACSPSSVQRQFTIPVAGHANPVVLWIESVTPGPGATVRIGDTFRVSHRQMTPAGLATAVEFQVGDGASWFRSALVAGQGCGGGTFSSQIRPGAGPPELRVRIWVRPSDGSPLSPPFTALGPPDVDASEPLVWTVLP